MQTKANVMPSEWQSKIFKMKSIFQSGVFAVAVALMLPVIGSPTAQGAQTRLFSGTFGSTTSNTVNPYPLVGPEGVAVDESTQDVYVGDPPAHRVEKFSASGIFLSMLGRQVNATAVKEGRSEAEQDVCPAPSHPTDVCQEGQAGSSVGAFEKPDLVAVDNSSDEAKGDLYVGDAGHATAEVQEVSVSATGGTYTLSSGGRTSAPIAYNAPVSPCGSNSPGTICTALEEVFGQANEPSPRGSSADYEVVFDKGELYGRDVPQLTADTSKLAGGTAAIATLAQGSNTARVEKFDPSGNPVTAWAEGGQLYGAAVVAPPAPISGPFGELTGIATDATGNLWVADANAHIFEFDQQAKFITGWSGTYAQALALDAEDNLYSISSGVVGKYSSAGEFLGQVAPSKLEYEEGRASGKIFSTKGLAIDSASGEFYIDGQSTGGQGVVQRYDSSCHPEDTQTNPQPGCAASESFGTGFIGENPSSAAIDTASSTDPLYIVTGATGVAAFALETVPDVVSTPPASPTLTSATLTGAINPSGVELNAGLTGCRFEWGETTSYGHTAPCDKTAAQIGSGDAPVEVHAPITGLQAGTTYHYRLVASNANDVNGSIDQPSFGQDLTFGPPAVEKASALEVSAVGATLQAQVDPNGVATRVRIEYGLEAGAYTQSTSEVDIGPAGTGQVATFELAGLAQGTSYHYRVVAESVLGEGAKAAIGADEILTTQPVGSLSLLDDRAWELVSPPNKHGAGIKSIEEVGVTQAAADGDAISYLANAPTEAVPLGNADSGVQVLSTRSPSGWASLDLATPHEDIVGTIAGPGGEYKFFSPDLSSAIVEPIGHLDPAISSEASEKTPFLRADYPAGDPAVFCTTDCYRPLVTGKPGFENVPPGTSFGQEEFQCTGTFCGPRFLGASTDATHIVLTAEAPLVEGAPKNSLYEWSAGYLQLVSILPGAGGPAPPEAEKLGSEENTRNAVSTDGLRVVWANGSHLYLRDLEREETLLLDRISGGAGKGPQAPVFQGASSDDSMIYFTDTQALTAGSGATAARPDLYRCQVAIGESGELECVLTDLTPANGTEAADVQGAIPGVSEDGSFAYFFADGVLAHNQVDNGGEREEANPAHCEQTETGTSDTGTLESNRCNLYVSHDGVTTFIASLSSAARFDWSGRLNTQPTRVSPNGEWLEFMSQRPLTAYDSRDAATGKPVAEVYLYNAAANRIVCASCDPSGARPHGIRFLDIADSVVGGYVQTWIEEGLAAATVPGASQINDDMAGHQSRYLSNSGRLFFNAAEPLVPQDSNGTWDVYEYEPAGVGNCAEASLTFSAQSNGCVGLVSSGTPATPSVFLDASENGDDVFFLTAAQLSSRDTDTAYDIYDARVGGGEQEPVKPVECQGDACQGFVEAPNDPTPDSLTFQGPGNQLVPAVSPTVAGSTPKKAMKCGKGKTLVRGKCVKRKAKRKKTQARRVNRKRGAKR